MKPGILESDYLNRTAGEFVTFFNSPELACVFAAAPETISVILSLTFGCISDTWWGSGACTWTQAIFGNTSWALNSRGFWASPAVSVTASTWHSPSHSSWFPHAERCHSNKHNCYKPGNPAHPACATFMSQKEEEAVYGLFSSQFLHIHQQPEDRVWYKHTYILRREIKAVEFFLYPISTVLLRKQNTV